MAYDGNGNFVRLYSWQSDKANGIDITASRVDGEDSGFAAGLTLCVTRDGQGKMAANFLPNGNALYDLGSASYLWTNLYTKYLQATSTQVQGWGPTAAALQDLTPDSGSFTGTFTGFVANPTATVKWVRVGKLVAMLLPAVGTSTTSNSITFTMTGAPAILAPATAKVLSAPSLAFEDNGSVIDGSVSFYTGGSSVLTFNKQEPGVSWTNSGVKAIAQSFELLYSLQ